MPTKLSWLSSAGFDPVGFAKMMEAAGPRTKTTHAQFRREGVRYESDLTDAGT